MRDILEYLKKEWAVLIKAPLSFIGLALIFFAAGIGVGLWHYSERLEIKDGEIHRLSVALGIDKASKGALVELNNRELALKARSVVAQLRQFSSELNAKCTAIDKRLKTGEIDQHHAFEEKMAATKEVSQEFNKDLASDAYNVENELRSRIDPNTLSHIVRVPLPVFDGQVTLLELLRETGLEAQYIGQLADEIEQMAKLLAPDSEMQ